VVRGCVRASPLEELSVPAAKAVGRLLKNTNKTQKNVFVECGVAGRAGAMRAIAPC